MVSLLPYDDCCYPSSVDDYLPSKTPSGGGTFARSHEQVAECCLSNHFRRFFAPSASDSAPGRNRARVSLTSKAFCGQGVKAVSAHYMATVHAAAGGRASYRSGPLVGLGQVSGPATGRIQRPTQRPIKQTPASLGPWWSRFVACGWWCGNRTRDSQIQRLVLYR